MLKLPQKRNNSSEKKSSKKGREEFMRSLSHRKKYANEVTGRLNLPVA